MLFFIFVSIIIICWVYTDLFFTNIAMFKVHKTWWNKPSIKNAILLFFTIVLGLASVMTFAQIDIFSTISNAWQTIGRITITTDGTNNWTVAMDISWTNIYINSGILANAWLFSWKVLWINTSGNLIYAYSQNLVVSWGVIGWTTWFLQDWILWATPYWNWSSRTTTDTNIYNIGWPIWIWMTTSLTAKLNINWAIKIWNITNMCDTNNEWSIRYRNQCLQVCDSFSWVDIQWSWCTNLSYDCNATPPAPTTNVTLSNVSPTLPNISRGLGSLSNACKFQCNTNYTYNTGTNTCVANTKLSNCTWLPVANAAWYNVSSITQTWNGIFRAPTTWWIYSISPSDTECKFRCNAWYTYNVWNNTCIANSCAWNLPPENYTSTATTTNTTRNYNTTPWDCTFACNTNYTYNVGNNTCEADTTVNSCSWLPTYASWNTGTTYIQTWNGSAFIPIVNTGAYNTTPSVNNCSFKCNTWYNYNYWSNTCDASTNVNTCSWLPTYASWNTGTTYIQTWNGSAFIPAVNTGTYSTTPSVNNCSFTCDIWYTYNAGTNTCTVNACAWTLPVANYTSTATTTNTTRNYNTTPWDCTFACNTNYTYNTGTNTCVADTNVNPCSWLPTYASWNTGTNYIQTWNGSAFIPIVNTGTYNITPSVNNCSFQCNTWYTYNTGNNTCIEDIITCDEYSVYNWSECILWFVSRRNTNNTAWSVTNANQVKLPLVSNWTYNFLIDRWDWNTETITGWTQNTHTYTNSWIYRIKIIWDINGFSFNNAWDKTKLIEIVQRWPLKLGNNWWYFWWAQNLVINSQDTMIIDNISTTTNLSNAFRNCPLITKTDISLSVNNNVSNMAGMFYWANNFNQAIWSRDTSNVTNMAGMFNWATNFNQPLSGRNTSQVTDMSSMFSAATNFYQPLSDRDTSKVTNMSSMFYAASSFNHPIWNRITSGVTNMSYMFHGAINFNQPIWNRNTSNVTDMKMMFKYATSFNRSLSGRNTSQVTNMNEMFYEANNFNSRLSGRVTSNVTDMGGMFFRTHYFNQPIGNRDTSKVEVMSSMFEEATQFNQPIWNRNTSNVQLMNNMFASAASFNQPIENRDTSQVRSMSSMFANYSNYTIAFNQPLSGRNTSQVTDMSYMFYRAKNFNQPIGNRNTSKVTTMERMFAWDVTNRLKFNQPIENRDVSNVTNMQLMFLYNSGVFNQSLWGRHLSGGLNGTGTMAGSMWIFDMWYPLSNNWISTYNYDTTLIQRDNKLLYRADPVSLKMWNLSKYSAGAPAAARASLISKNWIINDWWQVPIECWNWTVEWAEQCDNWILNSNTWECLTSCNYNTPVCSIYANPSSITSMPRTTILSWEISPRAKYKLTYSLAWYADTDWAQFDWQTGFEVSATFWAGGKWTITLSSDSWLWTNCSTTVDVSGWCGRWFSTRWDATCSRWM